MPSKVEIDVVADVRDATRKLNSLGAQADKTGGRLQAFGISGKAGMATAATAAAAVSIKVGKELFDIGMEADLLKQRVNTVFPEMADSIRSWADEVNESFGMSQGQVAGLAASTGDLLKPLGFAEDAAAALAMEIAELGNAHSLWSPEIDTAAEATGILNKALLGERDGLIALGLKVSQAQVDAEKLRQKQEGLTFASDEAATAAATLALITEQSADAMTFAGSEAAENSLKVRELQAKWEDLKEKIATAVLPILEKLIDWALWLADTGIPNLVAGVEKVAAPFVTAFGAAEEAIMPVIEAVKTLIGWIEKIPDIPDLTPGFSPGDLIPSNPFSDSGGRSFLDEALDRPGSAFRTRPGGQSGAGITINQTVGPGADPAAAGRSVVDAIEAYERTSGTSWRD